MIPTWWQQTTMWENKHWQPHKPIVFITQSWQPKPICVRNVCSVCPDELIIFWKLSYYIRVQRRIRLQRPLCYELCRLRCSNWSGFNVADACVIIWIHEWHEGGVYSAKEYCGTLNPYDTDPHMFTTICLIILSSEITPN